MATYRFVGTSALLNDKELTFFGQTIELTPEQAKLDINNRVALLSQADFAACGFTNDELAKYSTPTEQRNAPTSFLKKRDLAISKFVAAVQTYYASLSTPPQEDTPTPETPETPQATPEPVQETKNAA